MNVEKLKRLKRRTLYWVVPNGVTDVCKIMDVSESIQLEMSDGRRRIDPIRNRMTNVSELIQLEMSDGCRRINPIRNERRTSAN